MLKSPVATEAIFAFFERELTDVDFDEELEGGNSSFSIKRVLEVQTTGQPVILYGIYNRATGVRETETRQFTVAKEWVVALTKMAQGETLPGLGRNSTITTTAAEQAQPAEE